MTRVDFYQLADTSPQAPLLTTCKLVRKALREHTRIFIQVPDARMGEQLDELLWSFDSEAFVPHALLPRDKNDDAPVVIGVGSAPEPHDDLLINLSDELPGRFASFQRICELVPASDEQRNKARDRYKHYKDRGYPLNYHTLDKRCS